MCEHKNVIKEMQEEPIFGIGIITFRCLDCGKTGWEDRSIGMKYIPKENEK